MPNQYTDPNKLLCSGKCSVEGCNESYKAKGYCKKHYQYYWSQSESAKRNKKFGKLRTFGWSKERFIAFNYAQGGLCYLCGLTNYMRGSNKALAADHNHETEEPRGLLCCTCNLRLQRIEDNLPIILQYLGYSIPSKMNSDVAEDLLS